MKIAIIGTGISGLTAAYYLQDRHELTLYESADTIGGHTATVDVDLDGKHYAIDTGFIVYNDWTYPNFIRLLDELGVQSQATQMSFSVRCDSAGVEYAGSSLNTLFAQRRNLLRPAFLGMVKDILRFNRCAAEDLENGRIAVDIKLGQYLSAEEYGEEFMYRYLLPMGSAIWSASIPRMLDFPLLFFVRFFKNHGLLSVNNRPQWRVIKGGSRCYLPPLIRGFKDRIITGSRIAQVRRQPEGVQLIMQDGSDHYYDQVIMACHSDQALALLSDASQEECEVLAAIPYQDNEVVLHTDTRLLPQRQRAWSSWNYWLREQQQMQPVLTYNMNILQRIESDTTFCVTLNATDAIAPNKILRRFVYSHPCFSLESVAAVKRWQQINGINRLWFAGAYWGNGFHEDGVNSALRVVEMINRSDALQGLNRYA